MMLVTLSIPELQSGWESADTDIGCCKLNSLVQDRELGLGGQGRYVKFIHPSAVYPDPRCAGLCACRGQRTWNSFRGWAVGQDQWEFSWKVCGYFRVHRK